MAMVVTTVEIPDEVASGHDVVAIRRVTTGELYWNGEVSTWTRNESTAAVYPVLRKKWQWPVGFEGVAAMARNQFGDVIGFQSKPNEMPNRWDCTNTILLPLWAFPQLKDFPKPERWQDSLQVNPNFKQ